MNPFASKKIIFLTPVIILVAHAFATAGHWYWQIWWLDIPMHIAGGFWVAAVFAWVFTDVVPIKVGGNRNVSLPEKAGDATDVLTLAILCLGFVALVGVLLELWEFMGSALFWDYFSHWPRFLTAFLNISGVPPNSLADTMKDLADDLIGGVLALLVFSAARLRAKT